MYSDEKNSTNICYKNGIKPADNGTIFPNTNPYGGIPTNLTINVIGFILLLFVFLILRKSAWQAISKIVRREDMERWTHTLFSFTAVLSSNNEQGT